MTYQAPLLDPGYSCDRLHVDYGRQAVFAFFVISGYVIGLTTATPATGEAIRHYVSRRLLRIVPIAWLAVVATGLLLRRDTAPVVVGNLTFLQNSQPYPFGIRIPVLYDDPPLWSLSFEMLYYGLFVVIWRFGAPLRFVFAATILIAFADLAGLPVVFSRYAGYFVIWLCGLSIAWNTGSADGGGRTAWPASFFAAFAIWTIEPVRSLSGWLPSAFLDPERFQLDGLLGGLLLVLAATRRAPILEGRLRVLACIVGFGVLPLKLRYGTLSYVDLGWAALLGFSVLVRNWKPSSRPLDLLAPVGLVSYALYVTAFPLMRFIYRCPFLPAGSAGTFALRVAIYAALCAAAAIALERVVQPRLVRFLKSLFRLKPEGIPSPSLRDPSSG